MEPRGPASKCWDSEERVAELKKLWDAGLSASQIAGELNRREYTEHFGFVSRNAVIGKIHRLGLSGRSKGRSPPVERARKIRESAKVFKPRVVVKPQAGIIEQVLDPDFDADNISAFDAAIPQEQRVGLLQLTENTCRWPVGDPQSPDFFFCGRQPLTGLPYCAGHCRAAYQTPAQRREATMSSAARAAAIARGRASAEIRRRQAQS